MIAIEAGSADAAWREAAQCLRAAGRRQPGRGGDTVELLHVGLAIADPRQRLVFARPMNPAFAVAEAIWILGGLNDVELLSWWNPRYRRLAADPGEPAFHGAYGYRLGSQPGISPDLAWRLRHPAGAPPRIDQLRHAADALRHDSGSRQVVLQIWDAARDLPDPEPRSRDIPCNLLSHLLVREGRLEWLQIMRSNDLVWGLPYNLVQFTVMQEVVAGWLGLEVGTYQHLSSSLHVYERHWRDLASIDRTVESVPLNTSELRVGSYQQWEQIWKELVDCINELTFETEAESLMRVGERSTGLPEAYQEWVWLLTAEALRRRDHEVALYAVERAGPFWSASWRRWENSIRASNGTHGPEHNG